jgi:hypothetical protein
MPHRVFRLAPASAAASGVAAMMLLLAGRLDIARFNVGDPS